VFVVYRYPGRTLQGGNTKAQSPLSRVFCFGRYTRQGALAYAAEISGTQ
jgi:succinate dehydrogenase/fumarate reductase flavoprotein subunit